MEGLLVDLLTELKENSLQWIMNLQFLDLPQYEVYQNCKKTTHRQSLVLSPVECGCVSPRVSVFLFWWGNSTSTAEAIAPVMVKLALVDCWAGNKLRWKYGDEFSHLCTILVWNLTEIRIRVEPNEANWCNWKPRKTQEYPRNSGGPNIETWNDSKVKVLTVFCQGDFCVVGTCCKQGVL